MLPNLEQIMLVSLRMRSTSLCHSPKGFVKRYQELKLPLFQMFNPKYVTYIWSDINYVH